MNGLVLEDFNKNQRPDLYWQFASYSHKIFVGEMGWDGNLFQQRMKEGEYRYFLLKFNGEIIAAARCNDDPGHLPETELFKTFYPQWKKAKKGLKVSDLRAVAVSKDMRGVKFETSNGFKTPAQIVSEGVINYCRNEGFDLLVATSSNPPAAKLIEKLGMTNLGPAYYPNVEFELINFALDLKHDQNLVSLVKPSRNRKTSYSLQTKEKYR